MVPSLFRPRLGGVMVALALVAAALPLAAAPAPPAPAKVKIVAAPRYKAGPIHKALLGPTYRQLWTTPIEVEVLDVRSFAGGLKPVSKGGGKQTRSLKFEGGDGREWRVRSVDKDPTLALAPELRDTFVDQLAQDQISASHPAGALIVDGLADAAGIPYVPHRLVVLPDDPVLDKYREEFAGMLGTLEEDVRVEKPATPGFEGFSDKLDTVELWERLDEHPEESVDARAFLKARLFDMLIGDFDRHDDNWDWLKPSGGRRWIPYPTDRDQAFAKFDGFIVSLIRPSQPRLVDFEEGYPNIVGLTWQARFLDRRHLTTLEWPVWQEVAAELQARLTDPVVEAAVKRMPPEYFRIVGPRMTRKLQSRRNRLPGAARKFYEILTKNAEVHGTDKADVNEIRHAEAGRVEITQAGAENGNEPYFRRRFEPGETNEVRVYLKAGDDRVVRGPDTGRVLVRVIGGDGNDLLDDAQGGHTRFYDSVGENRIIEGPGTRVRDEFYVRPVDRVGHPVRDWGHMNLKLPWVTAGADLGVFLGAELQHTGYGFRKDPYQNRQSLRAGYSTGLRGARAEYEGEFVRTHAKQRWHILARYSGAELLRFYGFGNETCPAPCQPGAPENDRFHQVPMHSYTLAPAFRVGPDAVNLSVGPVLRFTSTRLLADRFITAARPYGVGDFGEVGATARLVLDGRNRPQAATRGATLWVAGTYYPKVWSVEEGFGEVHGGTAVYLSPPLVLDPTLALRVGGKRVWGRYPFHESAFIGGLESVRGLRPARYAGDAAAYGNAELRLALFRFRALVPARFGVFGLADAGRVWLKGEESDKIHTGFGGGIWLSFIKPDNTLSVAAARGEGHLRLYFRAGFAF